MKKRTRMFLPILVILAMVAAMFGMVLPAIAESPPGCDTNAVGIAITAYKGGSPTTGPVYVGDVITYRITLSVPTASGVCCDFSVGQLSATLPDGTNVQVAGFGGSTPPVPTVASGSPFAIDCPVAYTVAASDIVGGLIIAHADYGSTGRYPSQINGIFDSLPSPLQSAKGGTSNALLVI